MNLARIFTREEPVAGLEISESALRLVLLEIDRKTSAFGWTKSLPHETQSAFGETKSAKRVGFFVEEPVTPGIIVDGAIKNRDEFLTSLTNLVKKFPSPVRYCIASIPADTVYAKIFSFPKTIQGQKLEESMKLTVGFQLPMKPDDVYLDWEKISTGDQNQVFLASAPKHVINEYIEALSAAGLNSVAVEFHPLSLLRAADIPGDQSLLVTIRAPSSTTVSIFKNRILEFGRVIPHSLLAKEKVEDDIRKITDFYESDQEKITKRLRLEDVPFAQTHNNAALTQEGGGWIIAFGAALRGIMPRSDDSLLSLMPVGTEEAYEYHKAITFSKFIAHLTSAMSVFFAAAFVAVWIFMGSIERQTLKQIATLSSLPIPTDAIELETKARHLDGLIDAMNETAKDIPAMSKALSGLKSLIGTGITVSGLTLPSLADTVSLSGIAESRNDLDSFKKSIAASGYVSEIKFSTTDLAQTANIPFSATFRIANPQVLYTND